MGPRGLNGPNTDADPDVGGKPRRPSNCMEALTRGLATAAAARPSPSAIDSNQHERRLLVSPSDRKTFLSLSAKLPEERRHMSVSERRERGRTCGRTEEGGRRS